MPEQPIAALLIDIDDTLCDDEHASRHGLYALLAAHDLDINREQAFAHWQQLTQIHWTRFERGECSLTEQRHARVRGLLPYELDDTTAEAAFQPYLEGYHRNWKLFDDVPAFLATTTHLPRILVSNGHHDVQVRKLAQTGLDSHFKHLLTPQNCGFAKPDAGIFHAAAQLAGVALQHCMVIGDDSVRDIGAANALGIASFHVDRRRAGGSLLDLLPRLAASR